MASRDGVQSFDFDGSRALVYDSASLTNYCHEGFVT